MLIVDDNVDLAESLSWLLRHHGCRVDVAHDGEMGLDLAIRNHPDVVVIDISLPGMSGYRVAQALRSVLPYRPKLIAQTAYGTRDDRGRAMAAGFDDHFIKPTEPDQLVRQVASALRRAVSKGHHGFPSGISPSSD